MAVQGLSGVFSGVDTQVLIDHALASSSGALSGLLSKKNDLQAQRTAIFDFKSRLGDLNYLVEQMSDMSSLRSVTVATSDQGVAKVTASDGAGEGVFQIEVNRLASSDKYVHGGIDVIETWLHDHGVASADDEYISADEITDATGDHHLFAFQFGSEPAVEVDLADFSETGITLSELITEINMEAGYSAASAVSDSGYSNLLLQAQSAGEDRALSVSGENAVALLDSTDDFALKAAASNSGDALVGQGKFVYTYDGETRSITTERWTSLTGLVNLINNDSSNPGVTAGVLFYDGAEGGDVHLVLTGMDSGQDYTISVDAATTLAGFANGQDNWTRTQTAQDSQFRVDGYPSTGWIERGSNTITDAVPGGTLNLAGEGTTTITMSRSTSGLKDQLRNLAEVFNGLSMKIHEYTGYDGESDESGVLQGDYFLNGIYNKLRGALTSSALGFNNDNDTFIMAAQLGLSVDRFGEFSFDESRFDEAVSEDYQAVLSLVGASASGSTNSSDVQFTGAADSTQGGLYDLQVDFDSGGNVSSARIKLIGENSYRDMTVSGNKLLGNFGDAEQYLELTVVQGGVSETRSYRVNVQKGFASQLYSHLEDILDDADGIMVTKDKSYTNKKGWGRIDMVDKQIETQQRRLDDMEQTLTAKYARLESTLAMLDSQRGAYEALFSSIESSNNSNKD